MIFRLHAPLSARCFGGYPIRNRDNISPRFINNVLNPSRRKDEAWIRRGKGGAVFRRNGGEFVRPGENGPSDENSIKSNT